MRNGLFEPIPGITLFPSIALILRVLEHQKSDRTVVIAANYISAGTLSLILSDASPISLPVFIFAALLGLFFFMAFITFSRAIKNKGIAGAVTIGRLSLAVPVMMSIFLWGEKPFPLDILSLMAIFLIILLWENRLGSVSPILITLFLLFGLIDSAMKYFKLTFPQFDDGLFLVIVFYSAMAWSWVYFLVTGKTIRRKDFASGLFLGIPNCFSSLFLLRALQSIPAYVAFPFINVGLIILSALIGQVVFKEKLTMKRIFLVILGAIAVLFLTT